MKLLIENKKHPDQCSVHNLKNANLVMSDMATPGGRQLVIYYSSGPCCYTEREYNFFIIEVSMDMVAHKSVVGIPEILLKYAAEE